jgi:4-amino-4-deoxy-L-arabinose transferase-like glycosyltransferase
MERLRVIFAVGNMSNILYALVYVILACAILWVIAFAIALCAQDAKRRGKSPVLVALIVFLFFPLGLIAWLLFRPEPVDKGGVRPFRLEDYRVQ